MSNEINYYTEQAGSGLAGFQGYRHQRGHGFGSFFKSIWRNIVPYFAPKLVSAGVNLGKDYLSGENMRSSLKQRLRETGGDILDDASSRAQKFIQTGKGRRRKSPRLSKKRRSNLSAFIVKKSKKKSVKRRRRRSKHQFSKLLL